MSDSDTSPIWKKIYEVVSGGNSSITGDVVDEILKLCKEKLISGLLEYKPYTKESFQAWKVIPGLQDFAVDGEMCNFVHGLSKELYLDVTVAWMVMCNFLMFEYFGKVDELKSIIRYDTNAQCLIENVWFFYSGDRMFLLKTLRDIFESVSDEKHAFYKHFNSFLKSIDTKLLWNNLIKTFDILINEIDEEKEYLIASEAITSWVHRNNREQLEVVILLTHVIQHCQLDGKELENVLILFIRHGFTRHPLYSPSHKISTPKDLLEIKDAEIGLVLAIVARYFENPGTCKELPDNIEKNLQYLQIQGDNTVVLFAWALLKTSVVESNESLDYCNTVATEIIEKKAFASLHKTLTNTIFSNCKSGDIVVDAVYTVMTEFIKICADFTYLHEQEGVGYITAELLKRKGLVVLDCMGPIFQLSMDAFPFVFNPFLEMCKSLISIPGHYDVIMQLLKNIPSFLTEIPWNDGRENFHLVGSQQLFVDSDLFLIPEGTLVEKFCYQEMEFAKFIYPFSFFVLMEQFTKSLSVITFEMGKTWYCYDNLTELVRIGFEFINHILLHYEGDFKADTELRNLLQRLEVMSTQFSLGNKNFSFISLYFKINVTLIAQNLLDFSEVFSPMMRRTVLPQITEYEDREKSLIYNESILFVCLKEEESMKDHTLLIQYLKLVDIMVERDIYHVEVQVAGVWYLLNVVFPLHQQWSYEDEVQMTTICKQCVDVLVKVLQNHDVDKTSPAYNIFDMCANPLTYQDLLMSSYVSVFYKNKFYLQNLMQTESNWIAGPVLQRVENIRLLGVLLLLIYKVGNQMLRTEKCAIDNKISIICTAMSAYMINPYNVNLRILSYRFLEIISQDQNIPLMALLGLDYDQVQRLFLDKLRDPMEDDSVKLHIMNLISNCILCQHGMTAAFFNVQRSRKWYSDNKEKTIEGDTVADFMIDYLHNIKRSHDYLKSPLQIGILKIMVNLWSSRKQHLIKDILALDAFWPLLIDPLSKDFFQKPIVYAYILKIISMQLSDTSEKRIKFVSAVENFLMNSKHLLQWQKYILKILRLGVGKPNEIKENQRLIKAWMEFIIKVEKEPRLRKIRDQNTQYLFIEMCLDGVNHTLSNYECLETWVNLFLIQISYWGIRYPHKEEIVAKKLIAMFGAMGLPYKSLDNLSRTTALTIAQCALRELRSYFEMNPPDLLQFLEKIAPMMEYEHVLLEADVWTHLKENETDAKVLVTPWITCINIANTVLTYKNCSDCMLWFSYREYLPKLVKCTYDLFSCVETRPLAKIALHGLELYVSSPLMFDFLTVNMTKFYESVELPITTLLTAKNKIHSLQLEEGWTTCALLIKFNIAFLKRFKQSALPVCYMFMTLHSKILQHIMCLPETTVSLRALDLLLLTLKYFDTLLSKWQTEWYKKSNKTYNSAVNGIQKMINSCLYTILRPKNILLYELDDYDRICQLERVPIPLMVAIMDRLISAAGLGFSILYKINPSLIDLMDIYIPDTRTIILQNDFSVPKFELPIPRHLTYGKVLCLAHFMCKTIDASCDGAPCTDEKVPKAFYSNYLGLVEHQDPGQNLPNQKLSAFLRYAMYEYSGLSDPWIQKLNYKFVKKSLEALMAFLAQQVCLFVNCSEPDGLPYYKRNLTSELQFLYEHVTRQTSLRLHQEIPTPQSVVSSYKSEMDIIKRYILYCRECNRNDDIIEENFAVMITFWLTNFCHIP